MQQPNKRYKIAIDGHDYVITGPGSKELIQTAQHLLNQQLNHLKEVNPQLSEVQRANLVAFNAIADQINKQAELDDVLNNKGSEHK